MQYIFLFRKNEFQSQKKKLFGRYETINPLMNYSASATGAPFLISEMVLESSA